VQNHKHNPQTQVGTGSRHKLGSHVTAGYFIPDNRVMVGVSTCVAAALHSCVGIGSSLNLNQCLIFSFDST
jgi:hypothetical protein